MNVYYICHSAKGTTWKNHKYIKKINGVYYYAKDTASKVKKSLGIDTRKELVDTAKKTSDEFNRHVGENVVVTDSKGRTYTTDEYLQALDKAYDDLAEKYGNTKLGKAEAKFSIVNKVLSKISGSIEENASMHSYRSNVTDPKLYWYSFFAD
jgi:hypothetical protein